MKTILPKMMLACALMAGSFSTFASLPARKISHDSIFIFKQTISKSDKISMYPDSNQKVIFFSVKGEEGRAYQLFIFDLEGRLIKQTEIRNKETTVIKEMDKGIYLFDVFSDDMKIGNGQMTVR